MGEDDDTRNIELKVENWGLYFVQRMHHFYAAEKHCDLTLQFADEQVLKVHKIVLHACTDYFECLMSQQNNSDVLKVPEGISLDAVSCILTFMYTGKLSYHPNLQENLHKAATEFRMTILTRLLENQLNFSAPQKLGLQPDINVEKSVPNLELSAVSQTTTTTTVEPPLVTLSRVTRDNYTNEQKVLRYNDLKRLAMATEKNMPAPGHKIAQVLEDAPVVQGNKVVRRKIAPKENYAIQISNVQISVPTPTPVPPVPRRFEFKDDSSNPYVTLLNNPIETALNILSYEKNYELIHPLDLINNPVGVSTEAEPSAEKSTEVEISEHGSEQRIRSEIIRSRDDDDDDEEMNDSGGANDSNTSSFSPKPILKRILETSGNSNESAKRVRFTDENHDDSEKPSKKSVEIIETDVKPVVGTVADPAKIVTEVLKKYPNLMLNPSKHIKLKVRTNLSSLPPTVGDTQNAKVSYIYLKGKNVDSGKAVSTEELIKDRLQKTLELEKTKGPWICSCRSDGSTVFAIYSQFREHLIKVHDMTIDARLCEECGIRISKRTTLLHHMFVKHNKKPPPGIHFPQCDQCPYIASSTSALKRHRETHQESKDAPAAPVPVETPPTASPPSTTFRCSPCGATFQTEANYNDHKCGEAANPKKMFWCPYCEVVCVERKILQEHIIGTHWSSESQMRSKTFDDESSSETTQDSQEKSLEEPSKDEPVVYNVPTNVSNESEIEAPIEYIEDQQGNVIYVSQTDQNYEEVRVYDGNEFQQQEGEHQTEKCTAEDENRKENSEGYYVETEEGRMFIMKTDEVEEYGEEQYQQAANEEEATVVEEEVRSEEVSEEVEETEKQEEHVNEQQRISEIPSSEEQQQGAVAETTQEYQTISAEASTPAQQTPPSVSAYNSVMMFHPQPNVVTTQRVILAPGNMVLAPLQVLPSTGIFLSAPNIISEPIVTAIPAITTYTEHVVTGGQPQTDTLQKKVETSNLVSDWDESSQNEAAVNTANSGNVHCGSGPSRPEFF